MLFFANSRTIADSMKQLNYNFAIVVAIVSLWIMNIGLNVVQAAGTALLLDCCKTENDKNLGMSMSSFLGGGAQLVATLLGYVNFVAYIHLFNDNYEYLFYICTVFTILTTIPTLLVNIDEENLSYSKIDLQQTNKITFIQLLKKTCF